MAAIKKTAVLFVTIFILFDCGEYQGQTSDSQKISFEQVEISEKEGCDDPNSDYCAEIITRVSCFFYSWKEKDRE